MKLTKAQTALLAELPTQCAENYAPAKKLVALGLAEWTYGRYGDVLIPTDAGRLALPQKGGEGC